MIIDLHLLSSGGSWALKLTRSEFFSRSKDRDFFYSCLSGQSLKIFKIAMEVFFEFVTRWFQGGRNDEEAKAVHR